MTNEKKDITIAEAKASCLNRIPHANPGEAPLLAQAFQTLCFTEQQQQSARDSSLVQLFRDYVAHVDRHMRVGKDPEWTLAKDNAVREALGLDTIDDR
jgi:hypothetical protein